MKDRELQIERLIIPELRVYKYMKALSCALGQVGIITAKAFQSCNNIIPQEMCLRPSLFALGLCSQYAHASSTLFSGATIVAFDNQTESLSVIRDGSLLITDDRITAINTDPTPSSIPDDTVVVNVTGQIITPGFIDTHRHGWSTAWKTLLSNATLIEYFLRYREPAAAYGFTPEDVYIGQLTGLYEAMNAGVTTTLDHAHHNWSPEAVYAGLNATIDSDARVFWAYTFHEVPAVKYTIAQQIPVFREVVESGLVDKSATTELGVAYDGWGRSALIPAQAQQIADLVREYDIPFMTTHTSGGIWGGDNMPEDVHAFELLNGSMPVVFSHGTYLTTLGAQLLRSTNQYMSITPESEAHYGLGHPYSYFNQDQAALGVDTHFAFSSDILTQARMWLQEVRQYYTNDVSDQWRIPSRNPMSANQAFLLATRAGGLALRRPDLGVIQVGAKADLVVWDAENSPSLLGWRDPVAAVILHASIGDIRHVLIDGHFVKRNGKLTSPEYPRIRREFLSSARKLQEIWSKIPYPELPEEFFGIQIEAPHTADVQSGQGNGYGEQFLS